MNRTVLIILALFFILWGFVLTVKYYHFGYNDWDLAFNTQGPLNLLKGQTHVSLFDMNFFGNHAILIIFLLLPIFFVFPHPLTLVFLKLSVFIATAYLIYIYAKKKLGERSALLIAFLYLFFPANMFAMLYEGHYESLSPIFTGLMFYFFMEKRYRAFIVTTFLTILIKENMSFFAVTFGIWGLFAKDRNRWKWGAVPLLIGLVSFYLLFMVLMPSLRATDAHPFIVRYAHLGSSYKEILSTIFFHPMVVLRYLTNPLITQYVCDLFGSLLLPSLLSPHILFLITPKLFQHLLSSTYPEHSIYYLYGFTISHFIFFAAIHTLAIIKTQYKRSTYIILLCLISAASVMHALSFRHDLVSRVFNNYDGLTIKRWAFINTIPKNDGVISSFDFLAPLCKREYVYAFHKVYHDDYQDIEESKKNAFFTHSTFSIPHEVSWALIDFQDGWMKDALTAKPDVTSSRIRAALGNDWRIYSAANDIVLFKKEAGANNTLIEKTEREVFPTIKSDNEGDAFSLESIEQGDSSRDEQNGISIPFVFYWESYKNDPKKNHDLRITLQQNGRVVFYTKHRIGYTLYPTRVWKEGEFLKERFWLYVPNLPDGEYQVFLETPYQVLQAPFLIN